MAPWNSLKIDKSFWKKNKVYLFECKVQYYSKENGLQYKGKAVKTFTSRVFFAGNLDFTVIPRKGIPFKTEFTLNIEKNSGNLKCEFGYKNDIGRVVIPTSDTEDYMHQSDEYKSPMPFNQLPVTMFQRFPPNSRKGEDKNLTVFVKCWDHRGTS